MFGCSDTDVKHIMKAKLSNIAKAFKVQSRNSPVQSSPVNYCDS